MPSMTAHAPGHDRRRRREAGKARIQLATALAVVIAAVGSTRLSSSPSASAGSNPQHGIGFTKGCIAPTIVGDPYRCSFGVFNNLPTEPDTLTFTSIVDVVHANPANVSSGNIIGSLV